MSEVGLQERTVFVQNLKEGITQEELYQIFISFGEVKSIEIPLTKEKKTRGLAFIEFEDKDDALMAIENLNQAELFGKVIVCKKPKRFKEDRSKPLWEREAAQTIPNNDMQQEIEQP